MRRAAHFAAEALECRVLLAFVAAGTEFRANSFTTGTQSSPAVAADGDGDFVVAWSSSGQDGGGYGVYAQRNGASGAPLGGEFRVNVTTAGDQRFAAVAMDADGDFVVAWSGAGPGDTSGVFARRYSAAGAPRGGEVLVNSTTAGVQAQPAVAVNVEGDFVVAWEGQDGDSYGVFARRFDPAGNARGAEFPVNTTTASVQVNPDVAADADGDFVVVWTSAVQDGGGDGVFARLFDAAGNPRGGELPVNAGIDGNQDEAAVAMDGGGDFVVAWQSVSRNEQEVYVRRFDAAGNPQGGDVRANSTEPGLQLRPDVSVDGDGDFVVAWESTGQDGGGYGIYARRFTAAGAADGGEFRANTTTAGDQTRAAMTIDPAGDFVIAWQSPQDPGDASLGAYAQRYDELSDAAGPHATGVSDGVGPAFRGQALRREIVPSLVVGFSEPLATSGVGSVNNVANWQLTRLGVDVPLASVSFAFNAASNRHEATLNTVSPLPAGPASYVVTARSSIRDVNGIALDGDFDGTPGGGDWRFGFAVNPPQVMGGEMPVNVTTTGFQTSADVASSPGGNFVVVWAGAGTGDANGISARVFAASGVPLTGEIPVNQPTASAEEQQPAVAVDAAGNFVVAWTSRGAPGNVNVLARRFSAAGVAQGSEFVVNNLAAFDRSAATVAVDADGDFVVAWFSTNQDAANSLGVYARRFNSSGVAQGGEFLVNENPGDRQFSPSAAMDADGDFVIAWQHQPAATDQVRRIFARRYTPAGVPKGGEFQVSQGLFNQQARPAAAMDADGDTVIVWESRNEDPNSTYGIYGQRYDPAGAPRGGQFRANDVIAEHEVNPDVAVDADGDFVVSWQEIKVVVSPAGRVFARRFDADAVPLTGDIEVNVDPVGTFAQANVAVDADGDFVVAWDTRGPEINQFGIRARRFNQNPLVADAAFVSPPALAPQRLTYRFTDDVGVNLSGSDLSLVNLTTGQPIPPAGVLVAYNAAERTAMFTFPGQPGGRLPGGDYRATLSGGGVVGDNTGLLLRGGSAPAPSDHVLLFTAAGAGPDTTPPRVTGVFLDSTSWTVAYRQNLANAGLGSASLGFRIGTGAAQLDEMPWSNANRVRVVFSEDVVVEAADLSVTGVNVTAYALDAAAFNYDPVTFTATWTLAAGANATFPADKVRLDLNADAGGVADKALAANALDGEWVDGSSTFPSGNGAAGGDFVFNLRVLPGDVNRDGTVSIADINLEKLNFGQAATALLFGDANGDNLISIVDLNVAKANFGKTTPA